MWRRFWSAEVTIFLALWLILMLCGRSMLFRDPGTFWHTVVGEKILQAGRVLRTDPFSFTRKDEPWVAHQWLAECGMAAVYRRSGWDGLLLVTATLLAAVYTGVGGRLLRAGFHLLPVGLLLAVVLLASSHQFHVRPLILSIALLGAAFSLLVDIESGRRSVRQLWWFVPLAGLWANLHGGVLAGIGTVGLTLGGWSLAWALGKPSPVRRRRDLVVLAALLLASGVAVLVNPYGFALPRAWLVTLAIPLPSLIQEHQAVDLSDPLGWAVVLLGLGYVVGLIGVFPQWPQATWLLPLVWLALACQRVRNLPLFAITTAIACAEMLPASRWAKWLKRREMLLPPDPHESNAPARCDWRSAILPLVVVTATILLQIGGVSAPVVGRDWVRFDPTRWPVELIPKLKQINRLCPQESARIFNDLNFGGFVIFHAPRLRVFIDDRCALYGSKFLQAYDRARREEPTQLDRWQQRYGFEYALVETGKPFDRHLEDALTWTILQRTAVATLYQRRATVPGGR